MEDKTRKLTDDEISKTKILKMYSKGFPVTQLTTDHVAFYVMSLSMVTSIELSLAMQKIIMSQKDFPSVSEIIETVENMRCAILDIYVPGVDEAWIEINKELNKTYPYKEPVFSTPEIEQAVKCIGYVNICKSEAGYFFWQFKDTYNSILKRKKENEYTKLVLSKIAPERLKILADKLQTKVEGKENI